MDFDGKCVIVSGGTRGIGKQTALAFATQGAKVAVTYAMDEQSAEETVATLAEIGSEYLVIKADVGVHAQVDQMVASVLDQWKTIDIIVNNAGIHRDKLLMFMNEEDWDQVVAVNLKGTFLCTQAVLKTMVGNRWGRIINLASPSAITGRAGQTNYSAAKGGIISFTKSLSREVAKIGITVNAVCPGVIITSMTEKLDDDVCTDLKKQIPMGRFGTVEEVADLILFMASEQASYITGQVIAVDGGLT